MRLRFLKKVLVGLFYERQLVGGQRFRTFNVLDGHSREILAIEVDTNLPTARIIRVLERIVPWRGYPAKPWMDKGPVFILDQLATG